MRNAILLARAFLPKMITHNDVLSNLYGKQSSSRDCDSALNRQDRNLQNSGGRGPTFSLSAKSFESDSKRSASGGPEFRFGRPQAREAVGAVLLRHP